MGNAREKNDVPLPLAGNGDGNAARRVFLVARSPRLAAARSLFAKLNIAVRSGGGGVVGLKSHVNVDEMIGQMCRVLSMKGAGETDKALLAKRIPDIISGSPGLD